LLRLTLRTSTEVTEPLANLPAGSDIFLDANVMIYGLRGRSAQCRQLLDRCSRGEVTGICLYEILNEATHKFMLAEAQSKGFVREESARELQEKPDVAKSLTEYWRYTERLLDLNLLFLSTEELTVRSAYQERQAAGLLTNDSIIVSCMRQCGVTSLATNDRAFDRVSGITVFAPLDL
jgi:predicted nucleic acid-binding protein